MQVEHITEKGTVLFVKVPDDANKFSINKTRKGKHDQLHYFVPYTYDVVSNQRLEILTGESFQLIGITSDITEEQAKKILPVCYNGYNEEGYTIYGLKPHEVIDPAFITALDSFKSLMQHLQVYEVNPYGKQPFLTDDDAGSVEETETRFLRADAKSRTGKWVVLFKSN